MGEKLIELVRQYELSDLSNRIYRKNLFKDKLWTKIGKKNPGKKKKIIFHVINYLNRIILFYINVMIY